MCGKIIQNTRRFIINYYRIIHVQSYHVSMCLSRHTAGGVLIEELVDLG